MSVGFGGPEGARAAGWWRLAVLGDSAVDEVLHSLEGALVENLVVVRENVPLLLAVGFDGLADLHEAVAVMTLAADLVGLATDVLRASGVNG